MKTCTRCLLSKPVEEFPIRKDRPCGRAARCKQCHREDRVRRYQIDLEFSRQKGREHYQQNKDHLRKLSAGYMANRRRTDTEYREQMKVYLRQYFLEHREAHNARTRQWRARNPEKTRAYARYYLSSNRDKVNERTQRRRAMRRGNGGSYSSVEWRELCALYDHRCLCCGEKKKLTPDHIVAVTKGGSSDIANIQPLCLRCNIQKGNKTTDFRPSLG